jgi:2-polyprenyl-6-methoxyphenol hydroxylase-like FAD-dependent oxidoreductase
MKDARQARTTATDVLIAGAGPAGLALAAELQHLGVSPMIVDRQAAGANTSRAAVVQARTLEVLEPLGVTQDLIAEGVKVPVFRIRDRDRTLITIDFASIPSPYRFTLMCPQDRTERILLAHLERLGGSVLRPSELARLEEAADHVDVQLEGERGAQSVRARWRGALDSAYIIGSRKARARDGSFSSATPRMFTARRAGKA